jgi:hypothetical protein
MHAHAKNQPFGRRPENSPRRYAVQELDLVSEGGRELPDAGAARCRWVWRDAV